MGTKFRASCKNQSPFMKYIVNSKTNLGGVQYEVTVPLRGYRFIPQYFGFFGKQPKTSCAVP